MSALRARVPLRHVSIIVIGRIWAASAIFFSLLFSFLQKDKTRSWYLSMSVVFSIGQSIDGETELESCGKRLEVVFWESR